jgi:hypothetical protein
VPLKFYFGPKRYANFQHYFRFAQAKELVEKLLTEFKALSNSSETIYEAVLNKDEESGKVTVDSMIGVLPQYKDIIEDYCVELFAKKAKGKKKQGAEEGDIGKEVPIDKKQFCRWWSEGSLNRFEAIKYYLTGWMYRQLKEEKPEAAASIKQFRSYFQKRQEIKTLQDNYDSNFTLRIEGYEAPKLKEKGKQEETKEKPAATEKPTEKPAEVPTEKP